MTTKNDSKPSDSAEAQQGAGGDCVSRLVRLAPDTRIETTALPAQFWNGPATDCWIVRDDGGDTVLIGYGHDDRAAVPRSSIRLPNETCPSTGATKKLLK